MSVNRRDFLGWVGVGGAASSLWTVFANRLTKRPSAASASPIITSLETNNSASSYQFPNNFMWGYLAALLLPLWFLFPGLQQIDWAIS